MVKEWGDEERATGKVEINGQRNRMINGRVYTTRRTNGERKQENQNKNI